MANSIESRAGRRAERSSGNGAPSHQNPNFNIDRTNPEASHTYGAAHPKPTFLQKFLGVGPQAKDFSRARHSYNKAVYEPGRRELKHDRIRQEREWQRTKEKEEHHVYRRTRQLQEQVEHERDPGRLERIQGELQREVDRADDKFKRFVETTERETRHEWLAQEKELERGRRDALSEVRKELNEGLRKDDDEEPPAPPSERFA